MRDTTAQKWRQAGHATQDPSDRRFRRKVALSRWAIWFERTWPRFWAPIAVAATFVLASLAGLWSALPELAHVLGMDVTSPMEREARAEALEIQAAIYADYSSL